MKKENRTQVHLAAIGIDLGDVWGHYCSIDDGGNIVEEGRVKMTRRAMSDHFADLPPTRIPIGGRSVRPAGAPKSSYELPL